MKHPKVCKTCINYDPEGDGSEGLCTRYPVWEGAYSTHYCGEHEYNLVIQRELEVEVEQKAREQLALDTLCFSEPYIQIQSGADPSLWMDYGCKENLRYVKKGTKYRIVYKRRVSETKIVGE